MPQQDFPKLWVLGVYVSSDGYPNVKWRIESLRHSSLIQIEEICYPFRASPGQKKLLRSRWVQFAFATLRFASAHLRAFSTCLHRSDIEIAFIPYPAVFLLYMLSLLPGSMRPRRIIADAFISMYDTAITDRKLASPTGWIASVLRHIESRAYHTADIVIVDTPMSKEYFRQKFLLGETKLRSLPLAIDTQAYRFQPYVPEPGKCRILFIGTFVPLQGVEIIAKAIKRLIGTPTLQFVMIGSGQTAYAVAAILGDDAKDIEWHQGWQTSSKLAEEVAAADICLGVFGTGEKTQRVWPLKNYAYMSVGRALITGETDCAKSLLALSQSSEPFMTVPVGDDCALADAILRLEKNPQLRVKLATNSRSFYEIQLSAQTATDFIVAKVEEAYRGTASQPQRSI